MSEEYPTGTERTANPRMERMAGETDDTGYDSQEFQYAMAAVSAVRETSGVNLKGKLYSPVKDRVEIFRRHFGSHFRIDTQVAMPPEFVKGAMVLAIAKVFNEDGAIIASGHAMEIIGQATITTTNPVEVAETSAIGRALACFGLAGGEYASADEMAAVPRREAIAREMVSIDKEIIKDGVRKTVTNGADQYVLPKKESRFYVPTQHDQKWGDLEEETKTVIEQTLSIQKVNDLGLYWSDLEEYEKVLKKQAPIAHAALKVAFQSANNRIENAEEVE